MAKQPGQKLKLLYLIQIFEECTDENHGITMTQIRTKLQELMRLDSMPDRKSVYDDIDQLQDFGYDIIQEQTRTETYYKLASRDFEVAELKMMVDAIASSKFLSESKSRSLIQRLEKFCSNADKSSLNRQIVMANRVKSMNTNIHYNVDALHRAIAENKQVKFRYFDFDLKKQRQYYKKGADYVVSPWQMLYSDDNYYLVAIDDGKVKHFRVDKMDGVGVLEADRVGEEVFAKVDMQDYQRYTFNMYGGKVEHVTMQFTNHMMGAAIDRFGRDIVVQKADDWHFRITVPVAVSNQFFGWVLGLKNQVKIIGPDSVVDQWKALLDDVRKRYE